MGIGFYIDIISAYEAQRYKLQEKIERDEPIQVSDNYPKEEVVEIRRQIKDEIVPLAKRINRSYDFVKYANPDMSSPKIKRGLSAYVDFCIYPPNGLTDDEIKQNYKWSIRFSDHPDFHGEDKNRYYVELEGRKLNDLYNVGWRKLQDKLPKIQNKIRGFELKKFGEQRTFITDLPPVIHKIKVKETYAKQANMMTIRNQLMNKLGDDFKVTGGSTVPKIIVASEQRPSITFEITPNGQNVDIVPRYNNVPDTVHKKKGIAYMRAANILYDFIMNTVKNKSEGVERKMKLTIHESTRGKYFVGVFDKDQIDNEYNRAYVEQQTFKDRQSAWEFALKWNLKGFYVDFASDETVGYGDEDDYFEDNEYDEYTYEPYEMKDTFNSIHESWEDPENFDWLDDPFSEMKQAIIRYFKEMHDPTTKVTFKDLPRRDEWAMEMTVSSLGATTKYDIEFRDPYSGLFYVRPQYGDWHTFYSFSEDFFDWLDEDLVPKLY